MIFLSPRNYTTTAHPYCTPNPCYCAVTATPIQFLAQSAISLVLSVIADSESVYQSLLLVEYTPVF